MLVLIIIGLAFPLTAVAQQDSTGLVPGRRVRVHQHKKQALVGSFVSLDSAGIRFVTAGTDTALVPRAYVTAVDISMGTKSKAGAYALRGFIYGAVGGVIIGVAASSSDNGEFLDYGAGTWAAGSGLFFGALGAGVGALIGSGKRTDKWDPMAWPTVAVLPAGPQGTTLALGVRLRL